MSTTPDAVSASITYLLPPPNGERAYQTINADPTIGDRRKNIIRKDFDALIENVRGKEHTFTLDNAGFQYAHRPTTFKDFRDDKKVLEDYYPESEALIKDLTGASRVVFFDHTRRLRRPGELDDAPDRRQPVAQAHVDQTTASSIARVHRHLPPTDAPALLRRRFQIVNLWRPIGNPALDWPLALCDYRSVDAKQDTFPVALVYPDREGETMGVKHNPNHQWKYLRGMTPDEVVMIKCFDSIEDGSVARFTPHTGFQDPTTPAGAPFRESIELRALVFYD
ncbi:hypothetical protein D9756_007048 [Leucocoprinus leucothites]|uniref:Methyltransferase n=1 Tax=Leucocoprinus leucothites TaxID=201217 RepID=A0A8H5D6W2_9AGAR|nr:hypothetical protein D9756_007048 [Leucoagaricus leucothites]